MAGEQFVGYQARNHSSFNEGGENGDTEMTRLQRYLEVLGGFNGGFSRGS